MIVEDVELRESDRIHARHAYGRPRDDGIEPPTRRGRPVTVPNSFPRVRIRSPISSCSSLGNGPDPTRVVYAFMTATTAPSADGGSPRPVQAPPGAHEEEVTNGYVP